MCDPLSVSASLVALIGVASTSCDCLLTTLHRLSVISKEVEHQLDSVQALQTTLHGIAKLEYEGQSLFCESPEIRERIHRCVVDLADIEAFLSRLCKKLHTGKTHRRTWTKLRLALGESRETLKEQSARIESYHRAFSLELTLLILQLNLATTNTVFAKTPEATVPISNTISQRSQTNQLEWHARSSVTKSRTALLYRRYGPMWSIIRYDYLNAGLTLQAESTNTCTRREVQVTVGVDLNQRLRLGFLIAVQQEVLSCTTTYSLSWAISSPRIINVDSEVARSIARDDVASLRREFTDRNAAPTDVFRDGKTLLHFAASRRSINVAHFLIEQGADVNALDRYNETPLHSIASISSYQSICQVLLHNGADIEAEDVDGRSPLHTFTNDFTAGLLSTKAPAALLCQRDCRGMTPLHYMAWSKKTSLTTFVRCYEAADGDALIPDSDGRHLCHLAAERGNIPILQWLIHRNPKESLNCYDRMGQTPLFYAVESKRSPEAINMLVEGGARTDVDDYFGRSALCLAKQSRKAAAVGALLAHGLLERSPACRYEVWNPRQLGSCSSGSSNAWSERRPGLLCSSKNLLKQYWGNADLTQPSATILRFAKTWPMPSSATRYSLLILTSIILLYAWFSGHF